MFGPVLLEKCCTAAVTYATTMKYISIRVYKYKYEVYDWLNKFYDFYMAVVVGISSGRDVSIYTCFGN